MDNKKMKLSIAEVIKDATKNTITTEGKKYFNLDCDLSQLEYRLKHAMMMSMKRYPNLDTQLLPEQLNEVRESLPTALQETMDDNDIEEFFLNNKEQYIDNKGIYKLDSYCLQCKGECCKKTACLWAVSDFKEISYESIKAKIEDKEACIDWYDNEGVDPHSKKSITFILRVPEETADEVYPSCGGRCSMLTDKGCKFSYENRPKGGRLLRVANLGCESDYAKEEAAKDWKPYQEILWRIVNDYGYTSVGQLRDKEFSIYTEKFGDTDPFSIF